jgi:histone-lysine N-methyltransferase SETMAR
MLTLFWDEWGVILEHNMPRGNTMNSATYADLLKNHLRPEIKSKWSGLLGTGVLLQHDNARPHTAHSTVATIHDLSFECLPHLPYSPDLTPSDFHVFGPLKEAMGGKSFRSDEEVQQAVYEWLHSQPKDFFSRGIHALPKCWNTCMECNGDYVEKWCHCVPYVFNKLWDKKYLRFSFDSPSYIRTYVSLHLILYLVC